MIGVSQYSTKNQVLCVQNDLYICHEKEVQSGKNIMKKLVINYLIIRSMLIPRLYLYHRNLDLSSQFGT
jgi:hypothetical protein